jgi:hypothetical protein
MLLHTVLDPCMNSADLKNHRHLYNWLRPLKQLIFLTISTHQAIQSKKGLLRTVQAHSVRIPSDADAGVSASLPAR